MVQVVSIWSCLQAITPTTSQLVRVRWGVKGYTINPSLCMFMCCQVLIETLSALGAQVRWAACNIYSTQVSPVQLMPHRNLSLLQSWCLTETSVYFSCFRQPGISNALFDWIVLSATTIWHLAFDTDVRIDFVIAGVLLAYLENRVFVWHDKCRHSHGNSKRNSHFQTVLPANIRMRLHVFF